MSYDLLNVFAPMSCVLLIYPGLHASTLFLPPLFAPITPPRHNIRQINPNAYVQNDFAARQTKENLALKTTMNGSIRPNCL